MSDTHSCYQANTVNKERLPKPIRPALYWLVVREMREEARKEHEKSMEIQVLDTFFIFGHGASLYKWAYLSFFIFIKASHSFASHICHNY